MCVGITHGTALLWRSARRHVILLISLLILCLHRHRLALDNNSLQARRPTRPNNSPFRLHCPILSFLPYFPPHVSLEQHNAATTRHSYALNFISFCLPFMLTTFQLYHHHRQPRGRRYYTKPRHSAHVYKTAFLLVEEGMSRIPSITV